MAGDVRVVGLRAVRSNGLQRTAHEAGRRRVMRVVDVAEACETGDERR